MCRGGEDQEDKRRCGCDSSKKRRLRLRLADIFQGWKGGEDQKASTFITVGHDTVSSHLQSMEAIQLEAKDLRAYISNGVPDEIDEDIWYSGVEQRSTVLGEALAFQAEQRCQLRLDKEFTKNEIKMITNVTELGKRYSVLMGEYETLEKDGSFLSRKDLENKRVILEEHISEVEALSEEAELFTSSESFARYIDFEQRVRVELQSKYMSVLRELRDFGGTLNLGKGDRVEQTAVAAAVNAYYPSDWVATVARTSQLTVSGAYERSAFHGNEFVENGGSDSFEQIDEKDQKIMALMSETNDGDMVSVGLPTTVQASSGETRTYQSWRLGYRQEFDPDWHKAGKDGDEGRPLGEGWKHGYTRTSAKKGKKVWYTSSPVKSDGTVVAVHININRDDKDIPTSARHEVGHYFQHFGTNGSLLRMEDAFVRRRSCALNGGKLGIVSQIPEAPEGELYRSAGFVSPYSTRIYQKSYGSEVFTTGMEYVFGHGMAGLVGGHQKTIVGQDVYMRADLDHRNFILGALASI